MEELSPWLNVYLDFLPWEREIFCHFIIYFLTGEISHDWFVGCCIKYNKMFITNIYANIPCHLSRRYAYFASSYPYSMAYLSSFINNATSKWRLGRPPPNIYITHVEFLRSHVSDIGQVTISHYCLFQFWLFPRNFPCRKSWGKYYMFQYYGLTKFFFHDTSKPKREELFLTLKRETSNKTDIDWNPPFCICEVQ